jgi:hypothetical protein
MTQDEFLLQMAQLVELAGIPFMVVGSHSSAFHGHPRTTNDVDIVVDPTSEQLDHFLARLGEDYYVSREAAHEALRNRSMFNIIHRDSGWQVYLIVRKQRPFSVKEFGRRQQQTWHGRSLPIATAEDVILTKLEWDRITPSERQVRDATTVAAVQGDRLDRDYLRKWAKVLGVADKLEEVLLDAAKQQPS